MILISRCRASRVARSVLASYNTVVRNQLKIDQIRQSSSQTDSKLLRCLDDRTLLRLSGNEALDFLQGLITNDTRHFEEGSVSMYSLFLNTKGRVLYDSIVYKARENDVFYIECDSRVADDLQRHLKLYRVRRKVDIDSLKGDTKVWAAFDPDVIVDSNNSLSEFGKPNLEGRIFPCGAMNNKSTKLIDDITIYEDPRLRELGWRILTGVEVEAPEIAKHLGSCTFDADEAVSYKGFRYKLGIGEGAEDMPPGKALPLEINGDYLHGVSFHKGCYIGQELTARTHHTGVVRKRLMPLVFEEIPRKVLEYDESIVADSSKVVGKLRGQEKRWGLGLMRIAETLGAKELRIAGATVKVVKPLWWPQKHREEKKLANTNE